MERDTQVLMRTSKQFASDLKERVAVASEVEGRKVSIGEYVERAVRAQSRIEVAAFKGVIDAISTAAAETFSNWPAITEAYLNIDASEDFINVCVAGDAGFIIENGISMLQLGRMSEMMSGLLDADVLVTTEPRESYCDADVVQSYNKHKVRVW